MKRSKKFGTFYTHLLKRHWINTCLPILSCLKEMELQQKQNKKKALIYARVSSDRQSSEGHGLDSQEHRCREYAKQHGYEVEKVFRDSVTGNSDFMDRPASKDLIKYIESKPHISFVVIFDDIKRLARNHIAHWKLRELLKSLDVTPESPNFEFGDTEEAWLHEAIAALFGDFERRTNRRQVFQKMRARLEAGYWTFNSNIPGYKRKNLNSRDWILVRKEPEASIIQEALEGFASGRFEDQVDVQKFLEKHNFFGKKKGQTVYLEQVKKILTRTLYCGYIEYKKWEVEKRKGHHDALVSVEVFNKVQDRLNRKKRIRIKSSYNEDFPLRPYVRCSGCKKLFTASWSTGRSDKYPYYRCATKECVYGNKSVSKQKLEKDFRDLLEDLQPRKEIINLTKAILNDLYTKKYSELKKEDGLKERELNRIDTEIQSLIGRVVRVRNPTVVERYEERIEELSRYKKELKNEIDNEKDFDISFGTAFDEIMGILENPINKWDSENLEDKKLIVKLVFEEDPVYDKNYGFGTAELSCVLTLFRQISDSKSRDVEMGGIEPPSK